MYSIAAGFFNNEFYAVTKREQEAVKTYSRFLSEQKFVNFDSINKDSGVFIDNIIKFESQNDAFSVSVFACEKLKSGKKSKADIYPVKIHFPEKTFHIDLLMVETKNELNYFGHNKL